MVFFFQCSYKSGNWDVFIGTKNISLAIDNISLPIKLENFHWHTYISLAVKIFSLAECRLFDGQFNMPTVLATANERVIANERLWEVSQILSLAAHVSLTVSCFFIGKCFIGEKYKLPPVRLCTSYFFQLRIAITGFPARWFTFQSDCYCDTLIYTSFTVKIYKNTMKIKLKRLCKLA